MAISNVPKISGPDYGGVIYGLNLQMGYSSSPSKLIIDIINEKGEYQTPTLNKEVTVDFGNFKFLGIVWSYNIKETIGEKILQVEIIDRSIILDRHYVMLWKRGFFNNYGEKEDIEKEVFVEGDIVIPVKESNKINLKLEKFQKQLVKRSIHKASGTTGNIIFLGTEDIPDTKCDIPDSYYILDDLKDAIQDIVKIDFTAPKNYRATHEGTLREVLQAWAEDCGTDFYWDYSNNKPIFFDIQKGISNIPTKNSSPNLIEQSTSKSLEGTFLQQAFSYTQKPKGELSVKDFNYESSATININSFPISWFLKNNDTLQSLDLPEEEEGETENPDAAETNLWGGRTEDQFLEAAFLGYIDENLRDLWSLFNNIFYVCGINKPVSSSTGSSGSGNNNQSESSSFSKPTPFSGEDKVKIIEYLKKLAPGDLAALEEISPSLEDYNIYDVNIDENVNSKWKQIEQEILASYGSIYRHNVLGGTFFYCTPNLVSQVEITVDPLPDQSEPQSKDFKGLKIFRRQGPFSHDKNQAMALLGLQDPKVTEGINKLKINTFDNQSYKLDVNFPDLIKGKSLLIVPKKELFSKVIGDLDIKISKGVNNQEVTTQDIQKGQSETIFNCTQFDETIEKSKCKSLQDEALELEYKRLKIAKDEADIKTPLVSGLTNKQSRTAKISFGKNKITLAAPSDAPFTVVLNFSLNVKKIFDLDKEKIFFAGSPSSSDDVAQIDVLLDNVTNSQDSFMTTRGEDLPLAKNFKYNIPKQKSMFKFVGEPRSTPLSPKEGLSSIDISYSSEGFITTVEYNSRPPKRTNVNKFLDRVQSQLNRKSFNSN